MKKQNLELNELIASQPVSATIFGIDFGKHITNYPVNFDPDNERLAEFKQELLNEFPFYNRVSLSGNKDGKIYESVINLSSNLSDSFIKKIIEMEVDKIKRLYKQNHYNENLIEKYVYHPKDDFSNHNLRDFDVFLSGEKTKHTYLHLSYYKSELRTDGMAFHPIKGKSISIGFNLLKEPRKFTLLQLLKVNLK